MDPSIILIFVPSHFYAVSKSKDANIYTQSYTPRVYHDCLSYSDVTVYAFDYSRDRAFYQVVRVAHREQAMTGDKLEVGLRAKLTSPALQTVKMALYKYFKIHEEFWLDLKRRIEHFYDNIVGLRIWN